MRYGQRNLGGREVGDGSASVGVLIDARPRGEISPGLLGLLQGGLGVGRSARTSAEGPIRLRAFAVISVWACATAATRTLWSSARPAKESGVSLSAAGKPLSMAQVGVRSLDHSRLRILPPLGRGRRRPPRRGSILGPGSWPVQPELASTTIGEEVGSGHGGALGTVDGCGVPVSEPLDARLLPDQANLAPVPGAELQSAGVGVNRFDDGPLGGDEAAARAGSERDHLIAGPVGVAALADHLRARELAGRFHPVPRQLVELGHVRPSPRVQAGSVPGRDIGAPGVDRRLQGIAPLRFGMDAVLFEMKEIASVTSPSRSAARAVRSAGSCCRRFSFR